MEAVGTARLMDRIPAERAVAASVSRREIRDILQDTDAAPELVLEVVAGESIGEHGTISMTWPSGGALATISLATMPEAPGRFSTTTGWPKLSASFWAMSRPTMSVEPPGEKPSIRRTVLVGYACANALLASTIAAQIETNPQTVLVRISPPQQDGSQESILARA